MWFRELLGQESHPPTKNVIHPNSMWEKLLYSGSSKTSTFISLHLAIHLYLLLYPLINWEM